MTAEALRLLDLHGVEILGPAARETRETRARRRPRHHRLDGPASPVHCWSIMPTRSLRTAALFVLLLLSGCGGGPTNKELCLAIVAALPVIYAGTLCILSILEAIRRAPDRGTGSIARPALATTCGIVALAALVMAIGGRPDGGNVLVVLLAFGAVALGVSLTVWRARRKASHASRILVAAMIGSGLGLPAFFLWPSVLDSPSGTYIGIMTAASLLFAIYATPVLFLGLAIAAFIRRRQP